VDTLVTRVLIIVQNLPVPFDRRVWLECQSLVSDDHQVAALCPKGHGDPAHEVSFITEYAYSFLATAWLTLKARHSGRFGIMQAYDPPDIFWPIAMGLRALEGTRFVFDHHDLCPELYESRFPSGRKLPYKALRALERRTHRTADHMISTNESYRGIAVARSSKPADWYSTGLGLTPPFMVIGRCRSAPHTVLAMKMYFSCPRPDHMRIAKTSGTDVAVAPSAST
jgi:hypothetical protein